MPTVLMQILRAVTEQVLTARPLALAAAVAAAALKKEAVALDLKEEAAALKEEAAVVVVKIIMVIPTSNTHVPVLRATNSWVYYRESMAMF